MWNLSKLKKRILLSAILILSKNFKWFGLSTLKLLYDIGMMDRVPVDNSAGATIMVGWFIVFNATFNKNSVISRQSVLLVEENEVPGENHWPVASHWQTL